MAEEEIVAIEDDSPEVTPGYIAPAQKTLDELHNLDADDESLVKYKQTLLGDGASSPTDDPRRVIVEQMSFVVVGHDDIKLDLTGNLSKLKMIVKEGVEYKIKVGFKVHHEIVAGLRYHHVIKRKGIKVGKQSYMVGSYGPKAESQEWSSPIDVAPHGLMMRANYEIHSKFMDDDKNIHLEWDWEMDIKKDWQ